MAKFIVRYGMMRLLGVFEASNKLQIGRNKYVIARTDRGLEAGQILCEADERSMSLLRDTRPGQILREMTTEDWNEKERMRSHRQQRFDTCLRCIRKLQLQMQLVEVEHIFGGERIIVYYLAENRVDFRELVKVLASEFQTRIEMRQIGVRDEAKLMADYGDCGQAVCCNSHLSQMPPVSMKMAKLQKATLDPTKISGRCGRLKCCLRYEYETYEQIQKEMPSLGSHVMTPEGPARVLAHDLLAGEILVETDDHSRLQVALADLSEAPDTETNRNSKKSD
jgi:cell fate regulator YaaT (PSP1 superfamily)